LKFDALCNGLPIELRFAHAWQSVTFVNSKECEVKKTYVKPTVRSRAIRHGDIEASSRFAQKRSVPRYPFAARTVIVEPITRAEQSTRTSDMSLNGCYLQSVDQFPPSTIVRVRIE
jgi:hypothetical protein